MLCGGLDGRGVWGRMDTCICMAESLCCPPETITTLFIDYESENIKSLSHIQAPLSMGILQARILEWVAIPFLQGIFPTQGSNLGLPHCVQILYHLSHR